MQLDDLGITLLRAVGRCLGGSDRPVALMAYRPGLRTSGTMPFCDLLAGDQFARRQVLAVQADADAQLAVGNFDLRHDDPAQLYGL